MSEGLGLYRRSGRTVWWREGHLEATTHNGGLGEEGPLGSTTYNDGLRGEEHLASETHDDGCELRVVEGSWREVRTSLRKRLASLTSTAMLRPKILGSHKGTEQMTYISFVPPDLPRLWPVSRFFSIERPFHRVRTFLLTFSTIISWTSCP